MRLALSKLHLKTSGRPSASVTALIWRAIVRQCASDSTTLGPAIRKKGRAALRLLKKSDSCRRGSATSLHVSYLAMRKNRDVCSALLPDAL